MSSERRGGEVSRGESRGTPSPLSGSPSSPGSAVFFRRRELRGSGEGALRPPVLRPQLESGDRKALEPGGSGSLAL